MGRAVVGLDPSLTSFGVAVVGGGFPAMTGHVKSAGSRGASLTDRHRRISDLVERVLQFVPGGAVVVIEGPSYASHSSGTWDRAGLWHEVVRRLLGRDHEVVICPPTSRAKYATGKGNAGKDAVLSAVVRRYPDVEVGTNDEADALVMAMMGSRLIGRPLEESLPQAHLAAMSGLEVPVTMEEWHG